MLTDEFYNTIPDWFSNNGPYSDCIISTRIRLARNLIHHKFPLKASFIEKKEIFSKLNDAILSLSQCKKNYSLNLSKLKNLDKQLLFENRIVSSDLINLEGERGVVFDLNHRISIMINEEDHLRLQCMDSGYQPDDLWETINKIDDDLGKKVHYAYKPQCGFLTSCPTNSGTGLRISFLLHIPGLVLSKNIESVLTGASQMGISTRGFFGEHSDVIGNFFQLSNQATMGAKESEFLKNTQDIIMKIVDYEYKARERILNEAKNELKDKIFRSYGILKYAHTLSVDEFLNLTSALRFGIECGFLKKMDIHSLNSMILLCMPAHIQLSENRQINEEEINRIRAIVVKKLMPEI
ncbi:MAG: ATP--guanido phosphotransferase [Chitinispirillia bacterium]|jgi:protein arginine kinase